MPSVQIDRRTIVTAAAASASVGLIPNWAMAQATPDALSVSVEPFPEQIAAAIQAAVEETMSIEGIPGAAVYLQVPRFEPFAQPFGVANKETGDPVTLDMHFRIGSITKTFTGLLTLQLVDEGVISLDDTIDAWGFDLPNTDLITVRHLLSMSSGLVNYTDTEQFSSYLATDPTVDLSVDDIVALANVEPLFAPGEAYHYSNTNYVLLGLIAEQETGQDLVTALQERVWGPIGLTQTGLGGPMPEPFANGYGDVNSEIPPELEAQLAATPMPAPIATPAVDVPVDEDGQFDTTLFSPTWAWAAGEAWSTLGDLAVWLPALVAGETLSPELAESRFDWVPADPEHPEFGGYGLGIADLGGLIGHNGAIPGYTSLMVHEPVSGFSIIVLTNLYPGSQVLSPPDTQIANAALIAASSILPM